MIKVIFTIFAILFLTITSAVNHKDRVKLQNKTLVEAYPAVAEEYLENKYGEKFDIDPKYHFRPSGPIPGDTDMPYTYQVQENDSDRYMFRVYVYPISDKDKSIKMIEDNYYWKSIEGETKKYLENNLSTFLPPTYKMIFLASAQKTFGDLKLTFPVESYFSTLENQLSIRLYIVAPPDDGMEGELLTKENVYPILNDFYKKYSCNVNISFSYFLAESNDDYDRIDINQFESSVFMTSQEYRNIWDSVKLIEQLYIDIK